MKAAELPLDPKIQICESLESGDVISLVRENAFSHIVQRNGFEFERELAVAEMVVRDPKSFFLDPSECVLGSRTPLTAEFNMSLAAINKKRELLDKFNKFISAIDSARTIVEQTMLCADELYTNSAKSGGEVEFFARAEISSLFLGCRDSSGGLVIRDLVERIWACFESGVASAIRYESAGAGIGSYMVFDAGVSYYAGVTKGVSSVVGVVLPLRMTLRSIAKFPKHIHLIEGGPNV